MIALITGASGGIGYEFAKVFAGNGYSLVLVARNQGKLICKATIKNRQPCQRKIDTQADLKEVKRSTECRQFGHMNQI